MSETKHTPGPWITDGGAPDVMTADKKYLIAETYADHCGFEEAQANARLIAAAPELLECARAWMDYLEQAVAERGDEDEDEPELLKVRAAIARAEGRG